MLQVIEEVTILAVHSRPLHNAVNGLEEEHVVCF